MTVNLVAFITSQREQSLNLEFVCVYIVSWLHGYLSVRLLSQYELQPISVQANSLSTSLNHKEMYCLADSAKLILHAVQRV